MDQAVDQCTITSDDVAMDINNVNHDVIDSKGINDYNKTTNYKHSSNGAHYNYDSFNKNGSYDIHQCKTISNDEVAVAVINLVDDCGSVINNECVNYINDNDEHGCIFTGQFDKILIKNII